jgi:metal-responsive CopG/Arc/MetJ family transcriptional regulator
MKAKKAEASAIRESASAIRASISFPPDLYETLETIARNKKVSLAWVVRDAAERYVVKEIGTPPPSHSHQRHRGVA